MAELIPAGTTTSAWFDFTVGATPRGLFLKGATANASIPSNVSFQIAHKVGASNYAVIGQLSANNIVQLGCVSTPGDYGVRRMATTGVAAGMDITGS